MLSNWRKAPSTNIYSLLTPRQSVRKQPHHSLLLILALLVSGCATPSLEDRIEIADAIARPIQFQGQTISTRKFNFKVYQRRSSSPQETLVVYIEGDGRSWDSRRRISQNPTPVNPVALRLAARDPSLALVYIARPCQYLPLSTDPRCTPHAWTDARYSRDVVQGFMEILTRLKDESGSRRLGLIGFSGGGTIAALLAAERRDVAWLVTVAGNLNPDLWTRHHGISPLTASLNPVDEAQALEHIPQLHLLGADDAIMPAKVANSYQEAMRRLDRTRIVTIADQAHGCCWDRNWPQPLCANITMAIPSCADSR